MAENTPQQRVLFLPPHNNDHYYPEDYKLLCKDTPVSMAALPDCLLNCSPGVQHMPPMLWLGWNMGSEDDFFDYLAVHDPKSICVDKLNNNTRSLVSFFNFRDSLREKYELFGAKRTFFTLTPVLNERGETTWALIVGGNRRGCLPDEQIARLSTYFEKEPSWWLDNQCWYWKPGPHTKLAYLASKGQAIITPHDPY
ncbi:hypothetical protein CYLTODRAFT_495345 [Cylindrobasidium torrendii FP15055 ss-10]|uniref:Uncharacterized protein n=1 Tax=Cylindrobasidium torrendii FP15055 ss-10 TaxID=1314674 RepID=A0A0D7AVE9_9AGAR|nr:hypothetical protein CYLTODRAFT_495345 [Cylindrobasidium torrendii FP15055 ss-10]